MMADAGLYLKGFKPGRDMAGLFLAVHLVEDGLGKHRRIAYHKLWRVL